VQQLLEQKEQVQMELMEGQLRQEQHQQEVGATLLVQVQLEHLVLLVLLEGYLVLQEQY
jgi:hypothetical protein